MASVSAPIDLSCEHVPSPLGTDAALPRFGWKLPPGRSGRLQHAWQIQAAIDPARLESSPDCWDSSKTSSNQSVDIEYAGRALAPRTRYYWRVRVWDERGVASDWSEPSWFETGKRGEPWTGKWIGRAALGRGPGQPCPYLRRSFRVGGKPVRARLYATAFGLFELYLNGGLVSGADRFVPGWTDFKRRLQYLAYDVTDAVSGGDNVLGAILGEGWYCGRIGWPALAAARAGDFPMLRLELVLDYEDGSSETVVSDGKWRATTGPLLSSSIYDGEHYDARKELGDWTRSGYDDADWQPVSTYKDRGVPIVAKRCPPVRATRELRPVAMTRSREGHPIFDFGQNLVGVPRLRLRGEAGAAVTLRFAEMLKDDGELYTDNYRSAKSTDVYVCKGGGTEVYEPRFTFHGFRYLEVQGLRQRPTKAMVAAVVMNTDLPESGSFECSNKVLNQLQSNILWGQRGNYFEVPTDCPQRDERLGWTGDAQVFIRAASWNMDVRAFFEKWMDDMRDAQDERGSFPNFAPNLGKRDGAHGWGDAGVICPWVVYERYGDVRILEENYDAMKAWVRFREEGSKDLIPPDAGFGDWLAIESVGRVGTTPRDLIGAAYFAHSSDLVSRIAGILGEEKDAEYYAALRDRVKAAFCKHFVTETGRVCGETQTAYLLALAYDILPEALRPAAFERLVADLKFRDYHLSTGFLGTPLLCPVLTRFGRTDLAYRVLLQETYPGWLFSILQGATTMWERWNSYSKKDGFGDVAMNSFNHYAYGAVGDWMYSTILGLATDPERPGYRHVLVRPIPGGGLTRASGSLETPYGRLASSWEIRGGKFRMELEVPPNATATVRLGKLKPKEAKAGVHRYSVALRQFEGH